MSFDVNIGRSQPVIKAAANMNNDGGSGGNTGFMMRGRKKTTKKTLVFLETNQKSTHLKWLQNYQILILKKLWD